jgi:hypothetical protein
LLGAAGAADAKTLVDAIARAAATTRLVCVNIILLNYGGWSAKIRHVAVLRTPASAS